MKKILFVVIGLLMLAGTVFAVEPKVSYFYEVDNSQFITLIGTSVKEDVVDIKGLDIDCWYKWSRPDTEITYNDIDNINNLVMPGISYSIDIKGFDCGINVSVGSDRIENIKDTGEFKYGLGIVLGKKF
jgi:hypothetical protein